MIVAGSSANSDKIIANLLKCGADMSLQDDDGWTALHWACYHNRPGALKQLFEHDPSKCREILAATKDKKGFTPTELATEQESGGAVDAITAFLGEESEVTKSNEAEEEGAGKGKAVKGPLRKRAGK
jgi:ankyrin repeat protein